MKRVTSEEFRRDYIQGSRKTSPSRTDDQTADVCKQAVSAIQHLQGCCRDQLLPGLLSIDLAIIGNTPADIDNIAKGILDGTQGIVFKDDKQFKELAIRIHDCKNK